MQVLFLRVLMFAGIVSLIPSVAWGWTPSWANGYCLKSGGSCSASLGNAGGAGACCDPLSKEVLACAKTNPCVGTQQQKWKTTSLPLKWSFNGNNMVGKSGYTSLVASKVESDIKRSWDYWTTPPCTSFKHEYTGASTSAPDYFDGKVTIYLATEKEWATLGQGTGGILAFSVGRDSDEGFILDGDILLNPQPLNKAWGTAPVPPDRYDLAMVLAHEIGHSIGFGHTPDKATLMYFSIQGKGPLFAPMSTDEREAICTTYPATNSCQDGTECGKCRTCTDKLCKLTNPPKPELCKPCTKQDECGTTGLCVDTEAGGRCVQSCQSADGCCPEGYRCSEITGRSFCLPMSGQCPEVTCKDDTACGTAGVCRDGKCASKVPFDTAACARECTNTSDCGKNGLTCYTFTNGAKRCLHECTAGHFCPTGYSCQGVVGGKKYCVPHSLYLCPCQSNADCAKDQTCKNKRCQKSTAGKEGQLCDDNVPCATGLRCLNVGGGRCHRDCLNTACPKGQTCQSYTINIKFCVGPQDKEAGEACDNIMTRCKLGLACAQNTASITGGVCVQPCNTKSQCDDEDVCNRNANQQGYCGCTNDSTCETRGRTCKDMGKGYKLCICENPPCKSNLCGNLVCDRKYGEDCSNCPGDCVCGTKQACSQGACVAEDKCDPEAKDPRCKRGCGCQAFDTSTAPLPLLLLLLGLALARRRFT